MVHDDGPYSPLPSFSWHDRGGGEVMLKFVARCAAMRSTLYVFLFWPRCAKHINEDSRFQAPTSVQQPFDVDGWTLVDELEFFVQ